MVSLLLGRFHLFCVAETKNKSVSSWRNGDLVSFGVFPVSEVENLGYSVLFYSHLLFYFLSTLIITILKMHFKVEKKKTTLTQELISFCLFHWSPCLKAHIIGHLRFTFRFYILLFSQHHVSSLSPWWCAVLKYNFCDCITSVVLIYYSFYFWYPPGFLTFS